MAKSFDNREGWIWMNGAFIPWKDATSHVVSQGLHYASSVFEGERAYNGKIFKSKEHTDRLFKSAEIMGIEIPYSKDEINDESIKMFSENGPIVHNKLKDFCSLYGSILCIHS